MKGAVVNLNRERWLRLAALARAAATGEASSADLGRLASSGEMTMATPPADLPYAMTVCLSFRWACQAFGHAGPLDRLDLARSVIDLAKAVEGVFAGEPGPARMAATGTAAMTDDDVASLEPAWTRRADIAG